MRVIRETQVGVGRNLQRQMEPKLNHTHHQDHSLPKTYLARRILSHDPNVSGVSGVSLRGATAARLMPSESTRVGHSLTVKHDGACLCADTCVLTAKVSGVKRYCRHVCVI